MKIRDILHIEQLQEDRLNIDYIGKKLSWGDRSSGEVHSTEVFIALHRYSQKIYVEAIVSQIRVG